MKNKDDPHTKAKRVFEHYKQEEQELISFGESLDNDTKRLKRLVTVHHRKAIAGKVLNIGIL